MFIIILFSLLVIAGILTFLIRTEAFDALLRWLYKDELEQFDLSNSLFPVHPSELPSMFFVDALSFISGSIILYAVLHMAFIKLTDDDTWLHIDSLSVNISATFLLILLAVVSFLLWIILKFQ